MDYKALDLGLILLEDIQLEDSSCLLLTHQSYDWFSIKISQEEECSNLE